MDQRNLSADLAVRKHRHALANDLFLHPGIWEDFQLRTKSWTALLQACLDLRRPLTIVETGSANDGNGSTWILHSLVRRTGGALHTVDLSSSVSYSVAYVAASSGAREIHVKNGDSVDFIAQFDKQIDVLYLDSYDLEFANPAPSMEHHLRELETALPKLASHAIVAFDDTPLNRDHAPWWLSETEQEIFALPKIPGKGTLAIEHLETAQGYRVKKLAHTYQAVFSVETIGQRTP